MVKNRQIKEKTHYSCPFGLNMIRETPGDRELNAIAQKVAGIDDICDTQGDASTFSPMDKRGGWTVDLGHYMNKSYEDSEISGEIIRRQIFLYRKERIHPIKTTPGIPGGWK